MICNNLSVGANGHLFFAGQDTVELAKKYGTPLYLMDENRIRENVHAYKSAFKNYFNDDALMLYASKACSFKYIYEIMKDEGVGIDLVSSGELYTAKAAGFDLSKAYFHSNNKTVFHSIFTGNLHTESCQFSPQLCSLSFQSPFCSSQTSLSSSKTSGASPRSKILVVSAHL